MDDTTRVHVERDLAPTAEDMAQVRAGLMAFNESQAGPAQVERVAVYLRDSNGAIQGGLVGFTAWNWLSIDWLWVSEALRGRGHGSALLREAESLARTAGCVAVKLDTYEFQAKPFYEKHGYVVFGVLDGYPANTRTYYLQKAL
jgi:GNAT superfamily N-acetyltransferase